jgi:hypothetical protein
MVQSLPEGDASPSRQSMQRLLVGLIVGLVVPPTQTSEQTLLSALGGRHTAEFTFDWRGTTALVTTEEAVVLIE